MRSTGFAPRTLPGCERLPPPVAYPQVANAAVIRRERRCGPVGRPVVDDDHLVARRARRERRIDGAADEPRTVVGRNDDADGEIVHVAQAARHRPSSRRHAKRRRPAWWRARSVQKSTRYATVPRTPGS